MQEFADNNRFTLDIVSAVRLDISILKTPLSAAIISDTTNQIKSRDFKV